VSPKHKPLVWLRGEIKTPPFGPAARVEAGFLLRMLQRGDKLSLPHSRPLPRIGRRCHELRVADDRVTWRIIYRIDVDASDVSRSTTMRASKRKKLAGAGWEVGDATDFLHLSPEEEAYIELRLKLADGLKARRSRKKLTQVELAKSLGSSQSRVAKMEAGDPTVSVDLLVRSLIALGADSRDIAKIIAAR
jgi:DNA-binding XRE family transcriptional regulator